MTPQELINLCRQPLEGFDGEPFLPEHIYLVVRKKSPPRDQVRLAGRAGPLGRVLTAKETDIGYSVVATFNRKAVIAFLETLQNEGE